MINAAKVLFDISARQCRPAEDDRHRQLPFIEDGEIVAPEEVFYGFGEQQERLNKLMSQRGSLKVTIEAGLEIAEALTVLVRDLKKYRVE